MSKGRPLRVLVIDDSLGDSLEVLKELEEGGYEPIHQRVDNPDELKSALKGQSWDIVIADYDTEALNAFDAYEILGKKGHKVPFLLLADLISENIAVSAVKAGVEEIIMKSNLSRLVPAVERVLGEKAERREKAHAQETLKDTVGHLSGLIESSVEAIISTNHEGEVVLFNKTAENMLGYQRQEAMGQHVAVLFESEERVKEIMEKMEEGGAVSAMESVLRSKGGASIPVVLSASILYDEDGQEAGVVAFCEDLRDRKRSQEAKQRYARQKAAAAQFVSLTHKDVDIEDLMDAAAHLTAEAMGVEFCDIYRLEDGGKTLRLVSGVGWSEELVGSSTVGSGPESVPGYTLSEHRPVIVEDINSTKRFKGPSLHKNHGAVSGLSVPMASGETVIGVMGAYSKSSRDFSENEVSFLESVAGLLSAAVVRRWAKEELTRASEELSRQVKNVEQAQDKLILAEKVAVVEKMTAGVSHDILNPLNIISLRLQMMNKDPSLPPDMIRHLRSLEEQATRITKNIRDLLFYARKRSPEYRQMDINEAVTRTLEMLEAELGKTNISLELRLTEGLPAVTADIDQLQQVILNLLTNAREAMPEGGKLVLSTSSVERNGQSFVEFKIKDSGSGISSADIDNLFDPFFTTKGESEGTGLGLYVCQNIIEAHGGTIKAESVEGGGATFIFQLPLKLDKERS